MGTKIPIPIPPPPVSGGELCNICWGPGGPFAPGPTPIELNVNVTGVEKGPNWQLADGEPPAGDFVLIQTVPALPCFFRKNTSPTLRLVFGNFETSLFGQVLNGQTWFSGLVASTCQTVIANSINDHFTGGTAVVTIPPT